MIVHEKKVWGPLQWMHLEIHYLSEITAVFLWRVINCCVFTSCTFLRTPFFVRFFIYEFLFLAIFFNITYVFCIFIMHMIWVFLLAVCYFCVRIIVFVSPFFYYKCIYSTTSITNHVNPKSHYSEQVVFLHIHNLKQFALIPPIVLWFMYISL